MTLSPWVGENLIVVSTRERLVTEEMDGLVLDTRDVLLVLDVLQAVGLVPTSGEDIKRNLAADGVAIRRISRWGKAATTV